MLLVGFVLSLAVLVPFAILVRGLSPLEALTIPLGVTIAIAVLLADVWARERARS